MVRPSGYSLLGVEDTMLLEDLDNDGDGGVDGVRDDKHGCVGGSGRDACREIAHDARVDLSQ